MVISMYDGEPLARLEHDLRAPLSAIRAMVEALQDGMVTEPAALAQYHARIGRQIAQLSELVDDLFIIDLVGSAPPRPQLRPAHLEDLVAEVVDATSDLALAKGVHLTFVILGLVAMTTGAALSWCQERRHRVGGACRDPADGRAVPGDGLACSAPGRSDQGGAAVCGE